MRVSATYYGIGPDGTNRNVSGSCNQNLTDRNGMPTPLGISAFAELGNGEALGGLDCGTQVSFAIDNGPTLLLTKADTGVGGPGNPPKAIDIWIDAARANHLDLSQGVWVGEATVLGVTGANLGLSADAGTAQISADATSGAGLNGIMKAAMEASIGALLGSAGADVSKKIGELTIRAIELCGGSGLVALGVVMFALTLRNPDTATTDANPFLQRGRQQLKDYVMRNNTFNGGPSTSRTGTSTQDVRPLVEGGSTTAAERLATAGSAVGDVAEVGAVLA